MEKARINLFSQIHKGLKALLYHTALNLQHTDFTVEEQVNEVISKIKEVIELFEGHAETEDTMVFPLIKEMAPELVADFEAQHVKDHQLGDELNKALEQVLSAETYTRYTQAAAQLQTAFTEFLAFNLSHMNMEETIINQLIWTHYTDQEILDIQMKIVASVPPGKNMRYSYWMLKGLPLGEIIVWYYSIKNDAPSFVFDQFMELAESALTPSKYELLQEALSVKVMA